LNSKTISYSLIFFFLGLWLGTQLTSSFLIKSNNEIELLRKSVEFTNASISLSLHDELVDGDIEEVKKSLHENYEKAKKEANSLNLGVLAKENWPFTVDSFVIENLQNSINNLNNPYPCKNKLASNENPQLKGSCNG